MKKYIYGFYLLVVVIIAYFSSQLSIIEPKKINSYDYLIGRWFFEDTDKKIVMEFSPDKKCQIKIFRSKSDTVFIDGEVYFDAKKQPNALSIYKISDMNHPLHTIIAKVDESKLIIEKFAPKWRLRPISFGEKTKINLIKVER